jgi:hypothetical protein
MTRLNTFSLLLTLFNEKWIALVGCEGITNYIHMLGSGHVRYYLTVHRNLYKFSQQNWESLNEKMKITYFRSTQRGGHYGGKNTQENERYYLISDLPAYGGWRRLVAAALHTYRVWQIGCAWAVKLERRMTKTTRC